MEMSEGMQLCGRGRRRGEKGLGLGLGDVVLRERGVGECFLE